MTTINTSRARQTGTLVSVVDNRDGSFDCGEPVYHEDGSVTENVVSREIRWATVCEEHNTYMHASTRALAEELATCPAEWCEECRDAVEVRQAAAPPAAPQPLYLLVGIAPLVTHGVARAPHVSRSSVVVG